MEEAAREIVRRLLERLPQLSEEDRVDASTSLLTAAAWMCLREALGDDLDSEMQWILDQKVRFHLERVQDLLGERY